MYKNLIIGRVTYLCFSLFFSVAVLAQTPTLQDVTTSGNVTTNTIRLNRLSEPDVLGSRFLILGRNNAESTNMNNVYIFGVGNKLTFNNVTHSILLGIDNTTAAVGASLFGQRNKVMAGVGSTGIGIENTFSGLSNESIGIGTYNGVSSNQGNAIGRENNVSGERAQAFGHANIVSGKRGLAFGIQGTVEGEMGTSLGYRNTASARSSSSIGKDNMSSGEMGVAVGYANTASGKSSSALGKDNISSGEQSVAFGKGAHATGYKSVAIGVASVASADNSFAIGTVANDIAMSLKIGPKTNSYLFINEAGGVGIGTTDPKDYKLAVAGKMIAEEIRVKMQANWPDYVFEEDYILPGLKETEDFIKINKHLPGIPSAIEVIRDGVSLGEMDVLLLKKIEELTLHLIELSKENEIIKQKISEINK